MPVFLVTHRLGNGWLLRRCCRRPGQGGDRGAQGRIRSQPADTDAGASDKAVVRNALMQAAQPPGIDGLIVESLANQDSPSRYGQGIRVDVSNSTHALGMK